MKHRDIIEIGCADRLANSPHLYYGSTRNRYCNYQFLLYVKYRYGIKPINDVWLFRKCSNEISPFIALMYTLNFTIEKLNMLFVEWAMSNVAWKEYGILRIYLANSAI